MTQPRHGRAVAVALLLAFASCASSDDRRGAPAEVVFLDSDLFDKGLSKSMWNGADPIVVDMAAPVSLNDIPERLDRWIYLVAETHGGRVEITADPTLPTPKSVEVLSLALVIKAYSFTKESLLYYPARHYDLTLFVDPATGAITHAAFLRKPEAPK